MTVSQYALNIKFMLMNAILAGIKAINYYILVVALIIETWLINLINAVQCNGGKAFKNFI